MLSLRSSTDWMAGRGGSEWLDRVMKHSGPALLVNAHLCGVGGGRTATKSKQEEIGKKPACI